MGIKNILGELQINGSKVLIEDDLSRIGGADWNIADETDPAAIKNKPFGYVMGMVDVLPEGMYNFTHPGDPLTTDIVVLSPPFLEDVSNNPTGQKYKVVFNGMQFEGIQFEQLIDIPNGQFCFVPGALVIRGGNYEEGEYSVHIQKEASIAKKLNSEWLNVQNSLDTTDELDPISCGAVRNAVISLTTTVSEVYSRLNDLILLVTWDGDTTHPASHTAAEIYEHIASPNNRGIVMLRIGEDDNADYWPLISCVATYAEFGYISVEESIARSISINEDGSVDTYERTLVDDLNDITKEQNWMPVIQEIARNNIGAASIEALSDIDTALDRIIAIQEELIGESSVTLINFAIDGTEYQAEDGMTWGEWIDSDYNTAGATIMTMGDGNQLVTKIDADVMLRYNDVPPRISDMIINGATYVWD